MCAGVCGSVLCLCQHGGTGSQAAGQRRQQKEGKQRLEAQNVEIVLCCVMITTMRTFAQFLIWILIRKFCQAEREWKRETERERKTASADIQDGEIPLGGALSIRISVTGTKSKRKHARISKQAGRHSEDEGCAKSCQRHCLDCTSLVTACVCTGVCVCAPTPAAAAPAPLPI